MQFLKIHFAGFITGVAVTVAVASGWITYSIHKQTLQNTTSINQIVAFINSNFPPKQ